MEDKDLIYSNYWRKKYILIRSPKKCAFLECECNCVESESHVGGKCSRARGGNNVSEHVFVQNYYVLSKASLTIERLDKSLIFM